MNAKPCKICGDRFIPIKSFTNTCSEACRAIQLVRDREKVKKKEHRNTLKAFNDSDINVWKRKAIATFNKFIRERDKDKLCVSCGVIVKESMAHASHFKPAGIYAYLRFDESNVHKSCSKCNVFLHGNLNEYRIRIIERIGEDELLRLDLPNQIKKFSIDEYKEIIETYKKKTKDLINV